MKKGIYSDPKRAAENAAQKYIKEKEPAKLSNLFIALAVAAIPYAVLGILSELIGGPFGFLALIGTGAVFVLVYRNRDKAYKEQVRAQCESHYFKEFQRISQENQNRYDALAPQLAALKQRLSEMEQAMADPARCCVPVAYWHCGAWLCDLVESGQVGSLEQAIQVYLHNQQLAQQRQAEADAQRWAQLQGMMNRNLAGELDQKRKEQFRDAADWMFLAECLEME